MENVPFTPNDDNVLIKPTAPITRTVGGIMLPQNARQPASTGTVIAIGPGRRVEGAHGSGMHRHAPVIRPGDFVHFNELQVSPVKIRGVDYVLIKETMIYGVEEREPQ